MITRYLQGFFDVEVTIVAFSSALVSRDEELIREVWNKVPEIWRPVYVGVYLAQAARLRLETPYRWLLGVAEGRQGDEAIEFLVRYRLAEAICEVEAAGFDCRRRRPARAFARWVEARIPVLLPEPVPESVPASSLLAWHVGQLRECDIMCEAPGSRGSGLINSNDPRRHIDFTAFQGVRRLLVLVETVAGVVVGGFANCELGFMCFPSDPELRTAILRLEHPEVGPQSWRLNVPFFAAGLMNWEVTFGRGMTLREPGLLLAAATRDFALMEKDAYSLAGEGREADRKGRDGWWVARVRRWEAWAF
jgi:hypothetical protein